MNLLEISLEISCSRNDPVVSPHRALASRIGHDESCGLTFLNAMYEALKSGYSSAESLVPEAAGAEFASLCCFILLVAKQRIG